MSTGSAGRGAFATDGRSILGCAPTELDTGNGFPMHEKPLKSVQNAQNAHQKRTKTLGFSCFCVVLTGHFLKKSMVKPRRLSHAKVLSQIRPATPLQNSPFSPPMTIVVLQIAHFFQAPLNRDL
jgi:hypothetical protein